MPNPELLQILVCPETHQKLTPATPDQVHDWNQKIAAGQLKNRAGKLIDRPIESALIRADNQFAYPIRNNIPIMLVDEAFPI